MILLISVSKGAGFCFTTAMILCTLYTSAASFLALSYKLFARSGRFHISYEQGKDRDNGTHKTLIKIAPRFEAFLYEPVLFKTS